MVDMLPIIANSLQLQMSNSSLTSESDEASLQYRDILAQILTAENLREPYQVRQNEGEVTSFSGTGVMRFDEINGHYDSYYLNFSGSGLASIEAERSTAPGRPDISYAENAKLQGGVPAIKALASVSPLVGAARIGQVRVADISYLASPSGGVTHNNGKPNTPHVKGSSVKELPMSSTSNAHRALLAGKAVAVFEQNSSATRVAVYALSSGLLVSVNATSMTAELRDKIHKTVKRILANYQVNQAQIRIGGVDMSAAPGDEEFRDERAHTW